MSESLKNISPLQKRDTQSNNDNINILLFQNNYIFLFQFPMLFCRCFLYICCTLWCRRSSCRAISLGRSSFTCVEK